MDLSKYTQKQFDAAGDLVPHPDLGGDSEECAGILEAFTGMDTERARKLRAWAESMIRVLAHDAKTLACGRPGACATSRTLPSGHATACNAPPKCDGCGLRAGHDGECRSLASALVEAIMDEVARVARTPGPLLSRWEERIEALIVPHLITPKIARLAAAATATADWDVRFRGPVDYDMEQAYAMGERAEEDKRELDRAVAAMAGAR